MSEAKPIRVVQAYTGTIAKEQLKLIAGHAGIELVGVLVYHEEKSGRDAGEIAGIDPLGVEATSRVEDILALDADVVLYNPPNDDLAGVIPLLASGKNVITAAGGTNVFGRPELPELERACAEGNASFMGTGINPGYAPDVLPMVASSLCGRVDTVHVYAGGNLLKGASSALGIMGFGQPPESQGADSLFVQHVVGSYRETAAFLADAVSLPIDDMRIEPEFEPALRAFDVGDLHIEKGSTAGVRLSLVGTIDGRRVATLENTWFLGRENVPDAWLGPARDSGWTVRITGDPDVELNVDVKLEGPLGGSRLTAARMVNSIPAVVAAAPGPLTYLDVPIPRIWR